MTKKQKKAKDNADMLINWVGPNAASEKIMKDQRKVEMRKGKSRPR